MNKICRICLEEGVVSSIFSRNFNLSLAEMIEYSCNIKISRNDGLPEQLCSNCIYKLGVAYHFKQTCAGADERLRDYLGLAAACKNKDAAVMTDPLPVTTHVTTVRKCACKDKGSERKSRSNYVRKPPSLQHKRGPKPRARTLPVCQLCHREFKCQAQLLTHLRTHTGDKPFSCGYCQRSFSQKHNLTVHLRLHTGEKPFQCELCSKTFRAQGNLHTHIKAHTGQKDHVCGECDKAFVTSSELTRHAARHSAPEKETSSKESGQQPDKHEEIDIEGCGLVPDHTTHQT